MRLQEKGMAERVSERRKVTTVFVTRRVLVDSLGQELERVNPKLR
jgi:hypothetical protein